MRPLRPILVPLACVAMLVAGLPAAAQSVPAALDVSLASQPLGQALNELARQAGLQLLFSPELVAGKVAPAVSGRMTPRQALDRLLAATGLEAVSEGNTVIVRAASHSGPATMLAPVVVTANLERENAYGPVSGYVARRSSTGSKTDSPIIETPQSISVITADRIQAIGATTLKDALSYTPGVGISPYGIDSRFDWITVRGFDAYSPGFYMDGLPLRNNGNFGLWKIENYGAERIEILRGPASVLYGQGNPGGVVNVISKRPTAEPVRELQVQMGDHRRKQVAADFSGPLDADGKLLYRITGVVRDGELGQGGMRDDHTYIAPSLTWKPSSDTSLTLLSQLGRIRAGALTRVAPEYGSLVPTPIGTRIPDSLFIGDRNFDRLNQDQQMVGYQFEHRFDDTWTVRQNARYAHLDVDYRQLSGPRFVTVNDNDALDPANFRLLSRTPFSSKEKMTALAIDNQLQADVRAGDWQHKLLFGLDHQRTRIDQVSRSSGTAPVLDIYAPVYGGAVELADPYTDGITRLSQTGAYVQDQIKWREKWVFTLGGRYDSAEAKTFSRADGTTTIMKDHKFTARGGVVYLAPGGWAPYLSYAQSFIPTLALDPATGEAFKPETARQYEAGVRYLPPGRKESYSAAVFDLRRQNYVTYDVNFQPRQTGEVSVRGIELEATAALAPQLNVTASYSFTPRAIVTGSANPDEIGKQATAVPRHRLSIWGDYRFASGVKVGLGMRYTGTTRGENETASAKIPAVTIFDAMLGYDIDRWSLALNLRNLAGKTYIANCGFGNCYYGPARSVVATATYRW
ncbi:MULTISPECIES: TonB-dependent siderophore receptor [Pigmentiphaga]|uniref:TonB-dependent siderophore receptor n=1 Tax=Pigmentiphaga daeguensis TaxID=414049 RepID=A0ABN1C1K6_9BURK|nr:TonB-dependent siderophore receptor [Pigmentiphaga sp. NML030171]